MFLKQLRLLALGLVLVSAGCEPPPPSLTPVIPAVTSTLMPTQTPAATATPQPPTPAPTLPPIEGTTSTQLNVRAEPSTGSTSLGMLAAFSKVQITARDAGGSWYQVLYAQAPDGRGWVRSSYVQVADLKAVPLLAEAGGTAAGPSGRLTEQVNIRSGPGTSFDSLGTLNAQDVVTLTGRNPEGTWLQIAFTAAPDGRGWIAAAFLQTSEAAGLPILSSQGQVIGTGTPAPSPPVPSPTLLPARDDGDSASAPSASLTFSPSGAGAWQFTSDLSSPRGDAGDWVQFTPYLPTVFMRLDCVGNASISVDLTTGGTPVPSWPGLPCSGQARVRLTTGQTYLLHLQARPENGSLRYARFTLYLSVER
ncbi:MAG: SH3 domain-containing protein [Bacteroidota bacterium]